MTDETQIYQKGTRLETRSKNRIVFYSINSVCKEPNSLASMSSAAELPRVKEFGSCIFFAGSLGAELLGVKEFGCHAYQGFTVIKTFLISYLISN